MDRTKPGSVLFLDSRPFTLLLNSEGKSHANGKIKLNYAISRA
ncbi:hypothetical protein SBDP2_1440004 [Syntrophobacter sp. SbD2]|nr:hypothetical protein SBDP2_1440004 [Syntrophobacter sp. SbD2]